MAASGMWSVSSEAEGGGATCVFRASRELYKGTIGTNAGITAVTTNTKSTPVYPIGELVKVGILVPVNVYIKTGANKTAITRVYCSAAKADTFVVACRTDVGETGASSLTIGGKAVVSASRPRRQSFS